MSITASAFRAVQRLQAPTEKQRVKPAPNPKKVKAEKAEEKAEAPADA